MVGSRSLYALVRLRLRGAARRLCEGAQDGTARQLDLEIVVAETACALQQHLGRVRKSLAVRRLAGELRFRLAAAPRLVGDAAERDARLLDVVAIKLEADRDGDQRERAGE